jgi:hypothetical protein
VIDTLAALSQLVADNPDTIAAVDINPMLLDESGATAVDALIVLAS